MNDRNGRLAQSDGFVIQREKERERESKEKPPELSMFL